MGGLCFPLILKWRLPNSVFRCLPKYKAASPDNPALHTNIHEFIYLIINALFMNMYFTNIHHQGSPILTDLGVWIFLPELDNTSAISWIYILSCIREYHIVNLYHLFHHIVFYLNTMFLFRFDVQNIAVILNVEADALSRHQDHPTYELICQHYLEMSSLPDYFITPNFFSIRNACLSRTLTKATLNNTTSTLTSSKYNYFKIVARNWSSKNLVYVPSHLYIRSKYSSRMPLRSPKAETPITYQGLALSLIRIT